MRLPFGWSAVIKSAVRVSSHLFHFLIVPICSRSHVGFQLNRRGEPLPISEAWGHIADESDPSSNLEEGIEQTNLRKLPLCQVIVKNPLFMVLMIGKDVLQGPRNGR